MSFSVLKNLGPKNIPKHQVARGLSSRNLSSYDIAVKELSPFLRLRQSTSHITTKWNLPKYCYMRDVFREIRQSTDFPSTLSLVNKLDVHDVEVGSVLAYPNKNVEFKGLNLLLSRLESTRSDLSKLLIGNNQGKTYSFLVGVPKKDPLRYLPEVIEFLKKGAENGICVRPAFFMSADSTYSMQNQNMQPQHALDLHKNVFSFLKQNGPKECLSNCILYISKPQSDITVTQQMMYGFPGLVSLGDTNGNLVPEALKTVLHCAEKSYLKPTQLSLHLHGNPALSLHQDVSRIVDLLILFFKHGGRFVDGNCLPVGIKNQLAGASKSNERSGNLSFRLFLKVLVSLNIGSYKDHLNLYARILDLQSTTKSTDLFEGVGSDIIKACIFKNDR